jgi:hypothetical protein
VFVRVLELTATRRRWNRWDTRSSVWRADVKSTVMKDSVRAAPTAARPRKRRVEASYWGDQLERNPSEHKNYREADATNAATITLLAIIARRQGHIKRTDCEIRDEINNRLKRMVGVNGLIVNFSPL